LLQDRKRDYMQPMDTYIPPPTPGELRPLSREDHRDEDGIPHVPPSNFFLTTFPPSNSLTLFNQPSHSQSGPVIHFHTPLQHTVFPSVSQSLPTSPLPPHLVRDTPPHLGLPDGAAPIRRRRRSPEREQGETAIPSAIDTAASFPVSPSPHPTAYPTPVPQQRQFLQNTLPPPSLPVPPAPPPLPNIPTHSLPPHIQSAPIVATALQPPTSFPPPAPSIPVPPPPLPNIPPQHNQPPQFPPHMPPLQPPYHPQAPPYGGALFSQFPHPSSYPPNYSFLPNYVLPPPVSGFTHFAPNNFSSNSPSSVRNLPTLTHIPILSSRLDFAAWDSGIRSTLRSLGLVGHIASQDDPVDPLRHDTFPSYPPRVVDQRNQAELVAYQRWWEQDAVADHVVSTRLSSIVHASLPPDNIMGTRTARAVYESIKTMYGLRGLTDGLTVFNSLMALTCHPNRVQDFVVKWRAGVSQLHACRYPISARLLIQQFVCHLPHDAPAFYTLRAGLLARLQTVRDDDFQAVVLVTQEVLDLDNVFRPATFRDPRNPRGNRQPPHSRPPQTSQNPTTLPNSASTGTHVNANTTSHPNRRERPPDGGYHSARRDERPRDGGPFAGKRDDPTNNWHTAQVFLAETIDPPQDGPPDPPPPEIDWSAKPSSSIPAPDPMAFLASDVDCQVNEDLSDDFFDHFAPQSYATISPDLSNALALISVSPGPTSKLNTVLDSGSTHHIIRDRTFFQTYDTAKALSVKTANCGALKAKAMGTVVLEVTLNNRKLDLVLSDCLHAPDIPINLFSVGSFQEGGFRILFEPGDKHIDSSPYTDIVFPTHHVSLPNYRLQARFINRLSFLSCAFKRNPLAITAMPAIVSSPLPTRFPKTSLTPSLWHRCLGHPGHDVTKLVLTKDYVVGTEYVGSFDRDRCVPCLIGKSPQCPYSNNGNRATRIAELLHIDICGPFPTATPNGKKYFLSILDDCSNGGFTSLLAARSDAYPAYLEVEAHLELISGHKVLTVHLDNAPELVAGDMGNHFRKKGIIVQAIAPYAHAQNGKAERYI